MLLDVSDRSTTDKRNDTYRAEVDEVERAEDREDDDRDEEATPVMAPAAPVSTVDLTQTLAEARVGDRCHEQCLNSQSVTDQISTLRYHDGISILIGPSSVSLSSVFSRSRRLTAHC